MSSTREQTPPGRKRHRTEVGLDNLSESQPSKQLKSSRAEFYDSLSKVRLTRRDLKELDRRTTSEEANSPQRPTSSMPQQVYQREPSDQIKRFARHGGPELCDLRGYPAPAGDEPTRAMASSSSFRSRPNKCTRMTSNSSKRSSASDKHFEQHYIDHRVYPKGYKYPEDRHAPEPGDLDYFHQYLRQPRPSLSPSRFTISDFRDFERKNDQVINKVEVMRQVLPIIAGNSDIPHQENLLFTRLDLMTSSVIVKPKPDFYDSVRLEDINKTVREELGPYIIPTRHRTALAAPNFFMAAKAPHTGADVAKQRAMQNGAYGARTIHSLQSYSNSKSVYDGNAYTITSTYNTGTGTLKLYTTYPTAGPENVPEYHTSQVAGWDLTSNINTFREAATAFRNARDWAQEQHNTFITAANKRARTSNPEPTRTERMTYAGWLATLDQAQEPFVSGRDSKYPDCNPGETQVAEPFEPRSSATCEEAVLLQKSVLDL